MNRSIFPSHFPIGRAVLRCVVVVLLFTAFVATVSAANETTTPDPEFRAVSAGVSAGGKPMLVAVLALAGALIGMERACSWRLRVIQRSTAANQGLAAVLPSIRLADSPSLMSSRSLSRGNAPE